MGVHGLWRLIEPSGKPVPLETLENKVLAVDVSIWLHQIVKGFQDSKGASLPNAHLLGIYHRVCKLLYFRIKPVFVFDGGVPVLKRNTIALRNQQKQKTQSEADRIHKNLLSVLIKHTAISKVLSEKAKAAITASTSPTKKSKTADDDDLYVLPPSQLDSTVSSDGESDNEEESTSHFDLHSIDTESVDFKSLPVDVRHEILTDLKETRKQSSWGRINQLSTESNDFSGYQMKRLLKRQSVQSALEEVEKEMGGFSLSLGELEKLMKDQGVITNMKGNRIASDENTRFLLIKDIKQAMEEAKKQQLAVIEEEGEEAKKQQLTVLAEESEEAEKQQLTLIEEEEGEEASEKVKNKGDEEYEDDLKRAIAMSLEEVPSTSKEDDGPSTPKKVKKIGGKGKNRMPLSFLADFEDNDFDESESSEEEEIRPRLTPAQRYMMEYSGLTSHAIAEIIDTNSRRLKKKVPEPTREESKKRTKPQDSEVVGSTTSAKNTVSEVEPENNTSSEQVGSTSETKIPEPQSTNSEPSKKQKESPTEEENNVATSEPEDSKVTSTEDTEVGVISDSESNNSDDFVDVDANKPESTSEAMEVVIKPDEEVEDDLFEDIFSKEEKPEPEEPKISSTQDSVIESLKQFLDSSTEENVVKKNTGVVIENLEEVLADDKVEKPKTTSETVVNKIERMIETFSKPKLSVQELNEMKDNARREQIDLLVEKSTKERLAGNITEQMCQEAQELLELFGVPYLVAPMEAEAQCAFLELIGLTDGTITDDSDIWLFGGKTVYKNFFDQNKVVMEYKAENIHHHYKLTREQMILLAMLVGSDYTTGLTGVGPVTALEILAAFPPKSHLVSGLAEFKSWFAKGKLPGPGRTTLRGKLKNVSFTESFPNPQIAQAYLEPNVETSKDKFSWAKLDVQGLIEFARQKFGWTKVKSDEILNPILKKLDESRVQKSITEYFKYDRKVDSGETEKKMSKRVKTAIDKIAKGCPDEEEEEVVPKKKKRVTRKKKDGDEDEEIKILKETEARSKKRVKEIETEVQKEAETQNDKKKVNLQRLHQKEVIPQRQKDKSEILKNKMKAIETFRKSKQGPGHVKKRAKSKKTPTQDASYLSEDSSD